MPTVERWTITWETTRGVIGHFDGEDEFPTLHGALAEAEELFKQGMGGVMITAEHRMTEEMPV